MEIVSLDVSSSNVGCSIFTEENDSLKLKEIGNFELDTDIDIYLRFSDLEVFFRNRQFDLCIMEARLKSFFPGSSNKNAILAIAAANEIVSYIMSKHCQKIIKYHPNTWRKAAGFVLQRKIKVDIKQLVIEKTINNDVFQKYLLYNNLSLDDVFKTRTISKGKNIGQKVYLNGVSDMADSFMIGIGGLRLLNEKKIS